MITNSESVTHRIWASILDSVPRLMSHPCLAHLAASISWVSSCWYLILRICGPTMFCLVAIAPISELDFSEERALNCSDIGADCFRCAQAVTRGMKDVREPRNQYRQRRN